MIQRGGYKMFKLRVRTNVEGSSEKTEDRLVRTPAMSHVPRKDTKVARITGLKRQL